MKRAYIIFFSFLVFLLYSCGKSGESNSIKYLPVKLAGSELWSIVDIKTGEVIVKDEFKNEPSIVIDNLFYVKDNDKKYDYFSINSVNTPINSEHFVGATVFNNMGYAFVTKEGCPVSIINKKGEEVVPLSEDFKECIILDDDCFIFNNWEGKYGISNYKGEVIIPAKYDAVGTFSKDGYACMGIKNDNSTYTYSVIDKTGKEYFSFSSEVYESYTGYENGVMTVQKEKDVYLINLKGEKVLNVGKSKDFSLYQMMPHGDFIVFSDGVLFGLKNMKGETLIRAKYDDLKFSGDYLIAEKNEKKGLINTKDEVLLPFDYSGIHYLADNRYLVENGKLSAIVDETNKDIGTNNFAAYSISGISLVSSNLFNALKVANVLCDYITEEDCCGYKSGTKLSDEKTWVAEVKEYPNLYSNKKSLSSYNLLDFSLPRKTFNFDKTLAHNKYSYLYGYRFSDGKAVSEDAKLISIDVEQSVDGFAKTAEQQFIDAMAVVLPERGFKDNGDGVFVSEKGSAVSTGYNNGYVTLSYFFKSSDAEQAPRTPRQEKEE